MGQAVRFAPVAAGTVRVGNTHQTRDCLRYPREEIDDDSAAGRHRIGGTSTCYFSSLLIIAESSSMPMPRKPKPDCLNCGKEVGRVNGTYCSSQCQHEYTYRQRIQQWKLGQVDTTNKYGDVPQYIRRYLEEKFENSCARCRWAERNLATGRVPLQVHHLNGDWTDNSEDNLTLLCPNCHSLTPNYGARNKGKGRSFRMDSYEPNNFHRQTKIAILICASCSQTFEREWRQVGTKLEYGQQDFYCSSSCAARAFGNGRPKRQE